MHGNGNSWKSELELVAHPPPTVTGQVDLPAQGEGHHHGSHLLPAQGEGHHGSHPPGKEDSAAKLFLKPQGAKSWTWPPQRPGGPASASEKVKEINTWGGFTDTELKRKFGRKFDIEDEEEDRRKKTQQIVRKNEDMKRKTTYLQGPESEASPAPPRASSSKPARSAGWSASSPGSKESLQTPGGSSGRGEGAKGSQVNLKGLIFQPLHGMNCQTAAYSCTANFGEGVLKSGEGKTTALPDSATADQWEGRITYNPNTAASLAKKHPSHDGCNSQWGIATPTTETADWKPTTA